MPLLVMSKLSIEQSPRAARAEASASATDSADSTDHGDAPAAAFSLVRRQLESLSVDNMLLRRAVEDLRTEVRSGGGRPARPAARGEGRVAATAPQPQTQACHATKVDRRPRGAGREAAAEKADDVGEELKKALEARLR